MQINVIDIPHRNHISYEQIITLRSRNQEREEGMHYIPLKPQGIWYGFDTSWIDWGRSHDYDDRRRFFEGERLHAINLSDNNTCNLHRSDPTKVLVLSSLEECRAFHRRYHTTFNELLGLPAYRNIYDDQQYINWSRVAKDYAGIEIPHIDTDYRFDIVNSNGSASFTNIWNVPSGCIWNVDVITSFTEIDFRGKQ